MANALKIFIAFLPTIVCATSAFYLAAHGIGAWGWFLFAAVVLGTCIEIKGA